jgi:hypothetical protein
LVRCWRKLGIKAAPPRMGALSGYSTAELRTALLWFCSKLVAGKVYSPAGLFLHVLGCVHRGEKPIFEYSLGDIALVLEGHHPTELKARRLALLDEAQADEQGEAVPERQRATAEAAQGEVSAPKAEAVGGEDKRVEVVRSRYAEGRVDEEVPELQEAMGGVDLTEREGRRRAIHWAALLVVRRLMSVQQASDMFKRVLAHQRSEAGRALSGLALDGVYIEIENHAYEINVALGRVRRC